MNISIAPDSSEARRGTVQGHRREPPLPRAPRPPAGCWCARRAGGAEQWLLSISQEWGAGPRPDRLSSLCLTKGLFTTETSGVAIMKRQQGWGVGRALWGIGDWRIEKASSDKTRRSLRRIFRKDRVNQHQGRCNEPVLMKRVSRGCLFPEGTKMR